MIGKYSNKAEPEGIKWLTGNLVGCPTADSCLLCVSQQGQLSLSSLRGQ